MRFPLLQYLYNHQAVSYTHLDVYKRQEYMREFSIVVDVIYFIDIQ